MIIGDWTYYNHGWIPICAPHKTPDVSYLESGSNCLFKKGGVLARYTTEFDCGYETEWWYVILDRPFDISTLKSKRRYVIKQGVKNFEVMRIDPEKYKEEIYSVAVKAFSAYPQKYRPHLDREKFLYEISRWTSDDFTVYGAFFKESGEMIGYTMLTEKEEYIDFSVIKTNPDYEKMQVNAALVYKIVTDYALQIEQGKYICDGARNILHETHFPDYLEKYFGFRKAYCKLHIKYPKKLGWLIKMLYPIRKILKKFDSIGTIHQLNGVLVMENIVRRQRDE